MIVCCRCALARFALATLPAADAVRLKLEPAVQMSKECLQNERSGRRPGMPVTRQHAAKPVKSDPTLSSRRASAYDAVNALQRAVWPPLTHAQKSRMRRDKLYEQAAEELAASMVFFTN